MALKGDDASAQAKWPVQKTAPPPRLLSSAMAAEYLGISERTFRKIDSLPPPVRIGRRVLWDRNILDDWVDTVSELGVRPTFFRE